MATVTEPGGLASLSSFRASSVDVGAPRQDVLSAATDYGARLFSEGFEGGLAAGTRSRSAAPPGARAGSPSAAASPPLTGPAGDYQQNKNSQLLKHDPDRPAGRARLPDALSGRCTTPGRRRRAGN